MPDGSLTYVLDADPAAYLQPTSNPVCHGILGVRTWVVRTDEQLDAVPFKDLVGGDVVNILAKSDGTPYRRLICLRGQGSQDRPIVINGVTDSAGRRPVFDGNGASVAGGCMPTGSSSDVFHGTDSQSWQYHEALGLIVIAPGLRDSWSEYRPRWIRVQNIEVVNTGAGYGFTDARGVARKWDQSSGIRVQEGEDITIRNCRVTLSDFGIFSQTKDAGPKWAVTRLRIQGCYVADCGMVGRYTEHCLYIQGIDPVIEGCFIGQTRKGALGSSLKIRASRPVVRFSTIWASARAVDFVHSEDSWYGVQIAPGYGDAYLIGCVIINDFLRSPTALGSIAPIHVGGDNMGEDEGGILMTDAMMTGPSDKRLRVYIGRLFARGNTFIHRSSATLAYRISLFDLSLSGLGTTQGATQVFEWDNAYYCEGATRYSKVEWAGRVNHMGGSRLSVSFNRIYDARDSAIAERYSVTNAALLGLGSLGLVAPSTGDFRPLATSALVGKAVRTVSGLPASFQPELAVIDRQPLVSGNGLAARSSVADVGALMP